MRFGLVLTFQEFFQVFVEEKEIVFQRIFVLAIPSMAENNVN